MTEQELIEIETCPTCKQQTYRPDVGVCDWCDKALEADDDQTN